MVRQMKMRRRLRARENQRLLKAQRNEITEHFIYAKLAKSVKNRHNSEILRRISDDELDHYNFWKKYTGREVEPSRWNMWKYYVISRLFGLTFGVKLMENGEKKAQVNYDEISKTLPEARKLEKDEEEHENKLIGMINEEMLKYVGSIVLGLNDALVELTGALAGFTLALQNTTLVAITGMITGIAASLSMGASEYLSSKSEGGEKDPLKSAVYTGIAYIFTVIFLIAPFLLVPQIYLALGVTLLNAVIVIFVFTFYISVAKDLDFKRRFAEMVAISLGVAALTYMIGFVINMYWGIGV
jgi:VIT1/CCC1 family predicted Fe2+/Mn2+ transporter